MKIGIDCRLWNESGVGRYTRNLVQELAVLDNIDNKNEYVLFIAGKAAQNLKSQISPASPSEAGRANLRWKIVVADIRWHSVEEQIKFPLILNKENLDVVHFPYFSVPIFYKKPFIITIHDLILHHFSTGEASTLPLPLYKFKHLSYKFIVLNSIKRAKKIITVSKATKKEIMDHFKIDRDKITVTYEGVDNKITNPKSPSYASRFARASEGKQKSKIEEKYFLYVGNAYPHKNLERLITAFKSLLPGDSNVSLVLVGKEDYFYKRLKEKIRGRDIENKIIFYGEATDSELASLYKNALCLVYPSLMEGFGLPALEAMANKCLVLASDIPSFREICHDAAIYFNPFDVNDLVKKMEGVIYSNDLNHYSEKIRDGVKRSKMFSWERMAKETLKVYESCS